ASSRWMGAQYVQAFGERHTGAVFAQYMGYGTMTETDATGAVLGSFSPKDLVVGVGYSYLLTDRWAGGANLKLAHSSIANYTSAAVVVDLGLNYYDEESDLSVSAALRNLGAQIKSYDGRTETVPYSLQLGVTKGLAHLPLRFSVTAIDLTRWRQADYYVADGQKLGAARMALNHLVLGAQLQPTPTVSVSLGYNFRRAYELKAAGASHWAGLSAGLGIHLTQWNLQLAYARYHRSAASLMGTVAYSF
ncbi:MAG: type IX secretion system protein PorQ, partial [Bacteroidaceae bacterium]|nr:type IX secretion system protein PorQ [Bacteroidaceae bacterium]